MNEKNNLVKKSNYFIENARYELTLTQQKLILFVMGRVRVEDQAFEEYDILISEIAAEMGISLDSAYTRIDTEVQALMEKVFTIEELTPEGKKDRTKLAWFASFHHLEGSGSVQVSFAPRLKPYFLQLKTRFTTYPLACVLAMHSTYSIRIYELLKMELAFHHKKDFTLEEFKTLLQIDKKPAFEQYSNIKARILLPALKEINKNTDLQIVKFLEKKQSRKVIGFTLIFGPKPSQEREVLHNNYRAIKSIRNMTHAD
ncbi:replication initiation protein [Candidatus Cryosericum septentrionale]|jgi:plasmid replication initiation protein|uniref:Replication initiation protein n=1 Tax=Candidatus Cryosericum septentrionale TaxID=2290913 RepID=A0A398DXS3_9BACT|nr:replication initiation protein [Candidatus Cryosericum septentrionale]RIE16958.1 replication initiation protein [Candidatus Cryosericum septentrionale]